MKITAIRLILRRYFYIGFLLFCLLGHGLYAQEHTTESEDTYSTDQQTEDLKIQLKYSDNLDSSEATGLFLQKEQSFLYNDINPSQGSVQLQYTDLALPGKNGLDLVIQRVYNTKEFSNTTFFEFDPAKSWSGFMGQGWSVGPFQRAYCVARLKGGPAPKNLYDFIEMAHDKERRNHIIGKIIIESPQGGDVYELQDDTDEYRSKNPQNLNIVTIENNGPNSVIHLKDTQGNVFEFGGDNSQIFNMQLLNKSDNSIVDLMGGYLNNIKDIHGNEIKFVYKDINLKEKDPREFDLIEDKLLPFQKITFESYTYTHKVPYKIIDSMGREIQFYTMEHNEWTDEKKALQITGFSYKNTNGSLNKVNYTYNTKGLLTQAGMQGLPTHHYSYQDYDPEFRNLSYEVHHQGDNNNDRFYGAYYLDDLETWKEHRKRYIHENNPYTNLQGSILNQVTTPLGVRINYEYEECLTTYKPQWGGIDDSHRHYYYNILIPSGSFPVVTTKTVNDPTKTNAYTYKFIYPDKQTNGLNDNLRKYHQKSTYSPFWADETMYIPFFKEVTIKTPDELTDITLHFENGLPISESKTINNVTFETKTEWDFDTNRKKEVGTYKNGIVQTKTRFDDYDMYDHPRKIEAYVENNLLSTTTLKYLTDNTYIDQNLLHLVAMKTVKAGNTSRSVAMSYTNKGQVERQYKGENTSGEELSYITYDSYGRVISKTEKKGPAGDLTTYIEYSGGENGSNLIVKTTFNGKSTEQEFEYNTGKLIKTTDLNGQLSTITYDSIGRKKILTNPDGTQLFYDYSPDFKSITQRYLGNATTTKLDNFGRIVEENFPDGQEDIKTEYYFGNAVDKVYKKSNGSWTLQVDINYDKSLRPISKYVPEWGTTYTSYDDLNNTIKSTDYSGRETIQTMDKLGRTVELLFVPDGSKTTFSYTDFGEKYRTIDPKGLKHDVDYDADGRLWHVYDTYNQGSRKVKKEFSYYINGQPKATKIYDENQSLYKTIEFVYDSEGRASGVKENGVQKEWLHFEEPSVAYSKGQLTSAENKDVKTSYTFNNLGQVTQETTHLKKLNKNYTIKTAYTTSGQADTITYDDDKKIQYSYDSLHRITSISYDGKNIASYSYKANGSIDKMTYGNGITIDYNYENETNTGSPKREELLSHIEAVSNSNETIQDEYYTFDIKGNIATATLTHPITKDIGKKTYTYTIKDELTNIRLDSDTYSQSDFKQYTYDKNGNINLFSVPDKDPTPQKITRTINPNKDQLLSQTNENGSTYTFIYDAEGNLSKKTLTSSNETPSTTSYTYNYQGQLEKIVENDKVLATYQYNHKRQRVYSNTNSSALWGGEKYYYWDGFEHIIGEGSVENGDHVVRYIYSGNEKIAMIRPKDLNDRSKGENIYWFINNAQGTPTKIVNESGDSVQYNNVDEWGNPSVPYAGNTAEINFTGKKYDAVTGLYYFNQRYYDPALGIFLSEDPAMQGLNPYAYCANNPLGYVDPDGEWAFLVPILTAALKGAAISAGVNAGVQLATTGSIDWNNVGNAAISGAITGALGSGGGIFQTGENAGLFQTVGVQIGNNLINGVAVAAITGQNFDLGQNLMTGGLSGITKYSYSKYVGFDATTKPGKGAMGKDGISDRMPGESARKGVNTIGNPVNKIAKTPIQKFIYDIFPGREDGFLSRQLNKVPGMNSFSALHDTMVDNTFRLPGVLQEAWSATQFIPSFYWNYSALYIETYSYGI